MRRLVASSAVLVAGMAILTYSASAGRATDPALSVTLQITVLPTLAGSSSAAQTINDIGSAVGQRGSRAVLWEAGAATDLGMLPDDNSSVAYGVNDRLTVVGSSIGTDSGGEPSFQAFRWTRDGGISAIAGLGGDRSEARDVNIVGTVVGYAATPDGTVHAFRADAGAPTLDLGTLGEFRNSEALAINGVGEIVGLASNNTGDRRAFIFASDRMTALPMLIGGTQSVAYGINDAGQVVGISDTTDGSYHAFCWRAGTEARDLGPVASGDRLAINSAGDVLTSTGRVWHDGRWFDLGALLTSARPGWHLLSATGFNSSGQVVGQARESWSSSNIAVLLAPAIAPANVIP